MPDFDSYLKENRDRIYRQASENTPCNADGRPVIPVGDEWRDEKEWDEMAAERGQTT